MVTRVYTKEKLDSIKKRKIKQEQSQNIQNYMDMFTLKKNNNHKFVNKIIAFDKQGYTSDIIAKILNCDKAFVEDEITRYYNGQTTHTIWRPNYSCISCYLSKP